MAHPGGPAVRRVGPRLTLTQMLIAYAAAMGIAALVVFFFVV